MSAVLYLPYLPNINWLQNFIKHQPVVIEQHENFVKSTFRNRCMIAGANGPQLLSVPLLGGRDHHQPYRNVRISNTGHWQKKHWQAIRSAYGSAPYYEYYADRFESFYLKEFEFLFDFNLELLGLLVKALKLNSQITLTESFETAVQNRADLRNVYYGTDIKYYQVFAERNGFVPNLCALDLLFNQGPESNRIITI
ncbi:MAG TPA: WbqC family protein [Chitinophagales bacterium]|nr:WbqC family protein [Chitinophagales bacterium]